MKNINQNVIVIGAKQWEQEKESLENRGYRLLNYIERKGKQWAELKRFAA